MNALNLVAAGNGIDQRQGRQCVFTSVAVRMTAVIQQNQNSTTLRWMLFLDKMPDQINLATANIITNANLPIDSFMNLNNNKRIRILRTGLMILRNQDVSPVKQLTLFRRVRVATRYSGNGDTLQDITSNVLYFSVFSDAPSGTEAPLVNMSFRLRFVG